MHQHKLQLINANTRTLRKNMTESERKLWSRIRRKQILGLQFYRQRPIGNYIVDFYCPEAQLVLEVDGSQHMNKLAIERDKYRDSYLKQQGVKVLRFDNLQVLNQLDAVVEKVYQSAVSRV
ncbi:MAG: endonuclease domain-containing protein [Gammaproteobacteria bacterium]|nr:endonuclease domain-containing protein [Gammaproteobacteria bacterium]